MDVPCANCAAKIPIERDDPFLKCPFCGSALYLDRARTFKSFRLRPAIPRSRVPDLLYQHLDSMEAPRLPVRSCDGVLLPFWGVRGMEIQGTLPAFSPVPQGLAGFKMPPSGAVPDEDFDVRGFGRVPCSVESAAAWEGREDVSSFGLYAVPFYKVSYGDAGGAFTAWVDGLAGEVRLDESPPPLTDRITRRFWSVLGLAFLGLTVEALVIPSGLAAMAVVGLSALLIYPTVKGLFLEGRG